MFFYINTNFEEKLKGRYCKFEGGKKRNKFVGGIELSDFQVKIIVFLFDKVFGQVFQNNELTV